MLLPSAADLMEDVEQEITAIDEEVGAAVDSLIDVATANNLTVLVDAVLVSPLRWCSGCLLLLFGTPSCRSMHWLPTTCTLHAATSGAMYRQMLAPWHACPTTLTFARAESPAAWSAALFTSLLPNCCRMLAWRL